MVFLTVALFFYHTASTLIYTLSLHDALPAAYEMLLLDVMQGDATLFIRADEAEAQWRLITPIIEAWAEQPPPEFPSYAAGSDGPAAADELLARNGHRWLGLKDSRAGCD